MEYRIHASSDNPFGDTVVVTAAERLAEDLDHDGTNRGSVVVVDAGNGGQVAAWRFPADDPPPEPDLDARIDAAWDRLHAEQAVLFDLTMRRIARQILAEYPTAAHLRLVIRYPDETGLPDTWQVDEGAKLLDADRQPIQGVDLAEVDDLLGEDLLTLASVDEVHAAAVLNLQADPPDLSVPEDVPLA